MRTIRPPAYEHMASKHGEKTVRNGGRSGKLRKILGLFHCSVDRDVADAVKHRAVVRGVGFGGRDVADGPAILMAMRAEAALPPRPVNDGPNNKRGRAKSPA